MGEACRLAGVHGADINPAPALHIEDKPQHSNDSHWAFRCGIVAVLVTGLLLMLRVGNAVADENPVA